MGSPSSPDLTPVSTHLVERACATTGGVGAALYVFREGYGDEWTEFARAGDVPPPAPPAGSSTRDELEGMDLGSVMSRFEDVTYDGACDPLIATRLPARTPDGRLVGALCVVIPGSAAPDESLMRISTSLAAFAEMAGVAILLDQQVADQEQRYERERAVNTVVSASARHLDMDDLLHAALEAFRAGVRSQSVWIRAFDTPESAGLGRYSASFPSEADSLASDDVLDIVGRAVRACWDLKEANILHLDQSGGPGREVSQHGTERPQPLTTLEERNLMYSIMEVVGARSMLLAPLGGAGQCQGFISLTRSLDQQPFDNDDADAALRIGQELGEAIVQSRRFADQLHVVSELQSTARRQQVFVSTVVHQLKNPLGAILGHVELLTDDGVTSASLGSIQRATERLVSTVEDLLTMSRHTGGDRPIAVQEVSVSRIAARVCASLQVDADRHDVRIDVTAGGDGIVWGDEIDLERLVDNIVGNAVKYGREGGRTQVSVIEAESSVVFECRDDGRGISESEQRHLFEDFTRSADPAVRALPGSGLGLAIARRIVERHRGTVEVDSVLGVGSTFRVTLPRRAVPLP